MNCLVVAGAVLAGAMACGCTCTSTRITECDDLAAAIDTVATCAQLDAASRASIERSSKQIKDALKLIDDSGGVSGAPASLVQTLRDTCKTQRKIVVDEYTRLAPSCVK